MVGYAWFLAFLLLGVLTVWRPLFCFGRQTRLWLGMSLGYLEMMWLPALYAFFVDFSALAQLLAGLTSVCFAFLINFAYRPQSVIEVEQGLEPPIWLSLALVVPLFLLSGYLQYTHVLREAGGALYVGQSTYGDLCLHLSIATGLVNAPFPPEYTLLPDTLLGYPFLFDALSASLLTLGTPLGVAMALPATIAMGLVFWGFVLFAYAIARDARAVCVSYLLLFLNGGLGFLYTLDFWPSDPSRFQAALFEFYQAPANMPDLNLRWVNVLCDMMIPQRTLLGGWTILMPTLFLLVYALRKGRRWVFVLLGVVCGLLPMIHTHTFLAMGLIGLSCMVAKLISDPENRPTTVCNFLLFGGIAVALALPQLLTWTFPQTIGGGSLRFWFNWVNNRGGVFLDGYFWFWIKNVGIAYLLAIPAARMMPRELRPLAYGALAIYLVAECVLFQQNEYDNNKLFYVAFIVIVPAIGAYVLKVFDRLRGLPGRALLATVFLLVCTLSGGLSIVRETVSDYLLFDAGENKAAAAILQNTPRDTVFLTGDQHVNAPASLAGRKVVCGTPSYLYYHGVKYEKALSDARTMLESPETSGALFEAYGVDYIYLSAHERSNYSVNIEAMLAQFPVVYQTDGVWILAVSSDARATFWNEQTSQ